MRIAVLGAGPGGYTAAIRAAQLGAEVIVIEDREVGGTCLNQGCIPTKTIIASAELLSKIKDSEDFGIELHGEAVPNLAKIIDRKNKTVSTLVKGIRSLFKNRSIRIIEGKGVLGSSREIEVTKRDGSTENINADAIIIATGSRPAEIGALPFDGSNILSSADALTLTEIPKSMVIIGAGVIGCEFACIFRALGTEVTIVEMQQRAVMTEDAEISEVLERELKKKKIKLVFNAAVEKAEISNDGVNLRLTDGKELMASKVLVSIGRALNTDGLGLDEIGVKRGPRGEITTDGKMQTNVPGIYAVGDITGRMLLAHKASAEGIVAACSITGSEAAMDYDIMPAAIFTSPEIASVGLREHEAAAKGTKTRIGRFPFRALGKAHAIGEIAGLVKIIADEATDLILGAHIIGPHASDMIHEAAAAMKAGMTAKELSHMIHAHPTLAEGIMEAAEDLHGISIHLPGK